jgi:phenylalanyl-tRNA synthetase beta chain
MRVSLKWLRDYVDISVSATELGRRLTMAGIELDGIHPVGAAWDHVWTARIDSIERHPNADRLQLVTASYGEGRTKVVVTGATNISVGDIVPLGLVGARFLDGHVSPPVEAVLAPSLMRGVPSEGMVMSGFELGLSDDHSGILILSPNTSVGIPLAEALGDTVLELDVKGRPDGLSMLGIAREVAALTGTSLRMPTFDATPSRERNADEPLHARTDDVDRCPRFVAMLIKGVTLGPSPAWMQERLQAAGLRAINNVVDITNFVMIEYGQPLHAFDYDRIAGGSLVARAARSGESLRTLAAERDAVELHPDMTVVALDDAHGGAPISLAGIIGGAATEIRDTTTNILLEAANWHPARTRRTARALLPRPTDASRRYERGVPVEHALPAAMRAAVLMVELAGGEIVGAPIDSWPVPRRRAPITLSLSECRRILGIEYEPEVVRGVLTRLGFTFAEHGHDAETFFVVEAPSWRLDIEQAADLVEEVARIDGYDKVPSTLMTGHLPQLPVALEAMWEDEVRDALVSQGFAEVVSYTWTNEARLARTPRANPETSPLAALVDARINPDGPYVRLANPASADATLMRTSAVGALLDAVASAHRHVDRDIHLFEVGRIFIGRGTELPEERRVLTVAMGHWRTAREFGARSTNDFFDLKGAIESVIVTVHVSGHGYVPVTHPGFHPHRAAAIVLNHKPEAAGKKPIRPEEVVGILGEIEQGLAEAIGCNERVLLAAIDLDRLIEHAHEVQSARPLPRFPAVAEDVAFVVPEVLASERLTALLTKTGAPLLESAHIFDVYTGDRIPVGTKSLAYALTFRAPDRTLTGEEVTAIRTKIIGLAERQLGAKLRG